MPMARKPITRRRKADDAVSKAFGAKGAGVHSPSAVRPGQHGERLTHAFINAGFPLVTEAAKFPTRPALIEVFPLAALVRLMQLSKRPCYKISKTTRYWPNLDKAERLVRLRMMWAKIASALQSDVENIDVAFPDCTEVKTFAALKPHEDALDAIVCAWVGRQYLAGNAEPFGNANASIWIPCTEKKP
jgi:predicted RNase H-like nuclease